MPEAAEKVKGPAIGLIIMGALGILGALLSVLQNVVGFGFSQQMAEQQAQMPEWMKYMMGGGGLVIGIVLAVISGGASAFVLWAGMQMMKLRGHGAAMVASVIVMIPFLSCCCLIGLGIGIWSLIVLNKPEVRAAFAAQPPV